MTVERESLEQRVLHLMEKPQCRLIVISNAPPKIEEADQEELEEYYQLLREELEEYQSMAFQ